jgi:DNA replication and repair protein RecF
MENATRESRGPGGAGNLDQEMARIAVRRLSLTDFRSYPFVRLETDSRPVVLTGPNGAGKTNLLEALSYLVPGRGLRRAPLSEVGRVDAKGANDGGGPRAWAVAARIERGGTEMDVGTGYLQNGAENERARRVIKLDGAPAKNQAELGRQISAQWLTPQMDRLFLEGPSARRRFIDRLILGFDPDHAGPLNAYEQSLRNRNRLLRDGASDQDWFNSVEDSLASHGVAVAVRRRDAIARLGPLAARGLGPFPGAIISLGGALEDWLAAGPALAAEDQMRQALSVSRQKDAAANGTSIGPHRSDVLVSHSDAGLEAARCSTGEQKALLVSIVFAAAQLQAEDRGHSPLLLLDEVAAHLDDTRRDALFELVGELGAQAWMTGTDEAVFEALGDAAQRFRIDNGRVTPVD